MDFRFTGFADEAEKSLEGQISTLKEVGWDAIELRLLDGTSVCDLSDDAWAAAWEKLQAASIGVVGFGGQIANWSRPITSDFAVDVAELKRVAPRMRQCGAKLLRIMSYPNPEEGGLSRADWKAEAVRRIRELAQMAEDEGILLGHENCSGYGGTADGFLELVEAVDHPAFKMIFDTGNQTLEVNDAEATWDYYDRCREQLVHIHIKSAIPGPDGTYQTCFVDEDPIQKRILADLKACGYDGWISIEPHLKAAIHAGQDIDDTGEGRRVWVDYAGRLERLAASL